MWDELIDHGAWTHAGSGSEAGSWLVKWHHQIISRSCSLLEWCLSNFHAAKWITCWNLHVSADCWSRAAYQRITTHDNAERLAHHSSPLENSGSALVLPSIISKFSDYGCKGVRGSWGPETTGEYSSTAVYLYIFHPSIVTHSVSRYPCMMSLSCHLVLFLSDSLSRFHQQCRQSATSNGLDPTSALWLLVCRYLSQFCFFLFLQVTAPLSVQSMVLCLHKSISVGVQPL